ncbi:DUF2887 domain-containing protein [candidate division KSB1 bacterium]|nr:DUF2887 domain-containing protein [candidate division KSB1 bacterium]
MATDKLFHEYATHFTNAFAKFIGVRAGDYVAKSITLKQTEKRSDLFLIDQSGAYMALVETQGYDDEYLYHRMVATKMLYCIQHKYTGDMDAAVIFLEESNYQAALSFERQFAHSSVLKFSPKIIVFSRLKVEELIRLGGVHLIPLLPLCDISPREIEQQAPVWVDKIKEAPELNDEERRNLVALLGGFISHRIRTLTKETLRQLLGGFAMEDVPVIQEIVREKIQHLLLTQISARFGVVPDEIRQKIQAIDEMNDLDRIARALLTIQSVDELKNLVN